MRRASALGETGVLAQTGSNWDKREPLRIRWNAAPSPAEGSGICSRCRWHPSIWEIYSLETYGKRFESI